MARTLRIRGARGQVKLAYQMAAELTDYTVQREAGAWTLRATVTRMNPFALSQRPLTFIAPYATGEWRWGIRECQVTGGELTAQLEPPKG